MMGFHRLIIVEAAARVDDGRTQEAGRALSPARREKKPEPRGSGLMIGDFPAALIRGSRRLLGR